MDIISIKFAIIAVCSAFIFYLLKPNFRIPFLTLISCFIIAAFNYCLAIYVILFAITNYLIGIKITQVDNKILIFRFGIALNILQIIVLKYSSFAIDPFLEYFGISLNLSAISNIIVPVGISYFTLQGIGYLINIKMGWEKPERKLSDFLLYLLFFPKFLSGPIERSNHFLPQLKSYKKFDEKNINQGLRLILFGIFKKVVIANQLAPYIIGVHNNTNSVDGYSLWFVLLSQPLYLYFDFSGYTDIAIGLAKIFGINLLPNFNKPFFSENMTSFWKSFHISLSSWFNDYVFRQASFKYRKFGIWASVYALLLTWVLFGIWHGAGWNFIILGFVQAIAIIYEFFTKKWRILLFASVPGLIRKWCGRAFTYLFYAGSLVFFFSPSISSAIGYFAGLNNFNGPLVIEDLSLKPFELIIYIPVIFILELLQIDYNNIYSKIETFFMGDKISNTILRWTIFSIMITIIFVAGYKAQQFIYANF